FPWPGSPAIRNRVLLPRRLPLCGAASSHTTFEDEDMLSRPRQSRREILQVLGAAGEKERAPSGFNCPYDIVGNHLVAGGIIDERGIDVLNRDLGEVDRHPELRVAREHLVLKRRG